MVALKRDEFVLALFRGAPKPGTVSEICFALAADEIETVRASLQEKRSLLSTGSTGSVLTIRSISLDGAGAAHPVQEQARWPSVSSPSDLL